MPVRTGTEYIEALDERAIQVEIEGRALHGARLRDPAAPERGADVWRSCSTSSTTRRCAT